MLVEYGRARCGCAGSRHAPPRLPRNRRAWVVGTWEVLLGAFGVSLVWSGSSNFENLIEMKTGLQYVLHCNVAKFHKTTHHFRAKNSELSASTHSAFCEAVRNSFRPSPPCQASLFNTNPPPHTPRRPRLGRASNTPGSKARPWLPRIDARV
jgi:hypothetical protein